MLVSMTRESLSGSGHERERPALQVVERTFSILDLFTPDRPEWTTTEIARALGLPVPTAHRILAVLRRRSLVVKDEGSKRFRLGPGALDLGERARAGLDLRTVAHPILERLAQGTGETALLTVPNETRDRSVCVDRVESSHPLRLSVLPGRQLPLHAGAMQKALLAFLPEEDRERVLRGPLERLCRNTITDPRKLRAEILEIRRRGFATSVEETNVGVWGVAVPIVAADGRVVASIGLAGPSARMSATLLRRYLASLRAGAEEVARALGIGSPGAAGAGTERSDAR
jgi:IclR family acetate operon transcriptional repressor